MGSAVEVRQWKTRRGTHRALNTMLISPSMAGKVMTAMRAVGSSGALVHVPRGSDALAIPDI